MLYYDVKESGKRMKELRRACGHTQETMSEALGISLGGYKQIERGRNGASIDTLLMIAEELNTTVDYLITGRNCVVVEAENKDE